jgi:hypothetical protein
LQVEDLKAKLAVQEIELKQKNEAADALIEIVQVETQKVCAEKAIGKVHSTYLFSSDAVLIFVLFCCGCCEEIKAYFNCQVKAGTALKL